jgi:hypothetical protein
MDSCEEYVIRSKSTSRRRSIGNQNIILQLETPPDAIFSARVTVALEPYKSLCQGFLLCHKIFWVWWVLNEPFYKIYGTFYHNYRSIPTRNGKKWLQKYF